MPSTRKQKAKEKRSRQLDIMSDVENVDIMLGSYSRDDENNASEDEMNLDSRSNRLQQSSNVIGEDFRSLLNTNSRENSQVTIETTRIISDEISNQISRRLNEIKTSLNFQIQDAISNAITEKVLPSIQNTLEMQGRPNFTMVVQPKVQRATSQPKVDRIHHKGPKVQWATTERRSRKFAGNGGKSP